MASNGRNKLTVGFTGFKEMFAKLDKLEADTKKITTEALEKSFETVTPGIQAAIAPHKKSGDTEKSLVKTPNVKWEGMQASVEVGFDIDNGGLPSVFLMYGTPRHNVRNKYGSTGKTMKGIDRDMNLLRSVYGSRTKQKVKEVQEDVFRKAIKEAME